jgi:hypothetical protein
MNTISANITAKETIKVDIVSGVTPDADTVDGKHASAFADVSHAHPESDVTNLVTDLAGKAPAAAKYIVQEAHEGLSAEQSLGALATGVLKNVVTAGIGVLSTFILTISDSAASGGNDGDIWMEY